MELNSLHCAEVPLRNCSLTQSLPCCTENLESKMKWLKNFERLQELQQQIIWRPITELEPRSFIPEVQSCISHSVIYF